jgi:hypothetical protein
MKDKVIYQQLKSGNYLEQACLKGLSDNQAKYARGKIKEWGDKGIAVLYGIIRKIALEKH